MKQILFGAVILPFILISLAWATSFMERPFPDSVRAAPHIIRGTVGKSKVDTLQSPDGTEFFYTFYSFRVREALKSSATTPAPAPSSIITFREIGGERNGVGMDVSGSAKFKEGDDVVVFLGEPKDEVYPLLGLMMGRYDVKKHADGKDYISGPGLGLSGNPPPWSLESVRELIQKQKIEVDSQLALSQNSSENSSDSDSTEGQGSEKEARKSVQSPPPPKTSLLPNPNEKSADSAQSQSNPSDSSRSNTTNTDGETRRTPSVWVVLAGILTGVYFYIKRKKKP